MAARIAIMRALWHVGIGLIIISLALWLISLFNVVWVSGSRSTNLRLSQAAFVGWFCSPGDWNASEAGLHWGRFWGFVPIRYQPKFERGAQIWVQSRPRPPGAPPTAIIISKAIHGLRIEAPLWMPLALGGLLVLAGWPAQRRRRRRRHGRCERCGYDLRASAGACPECGFERAGSAA